MHRFGNRRARRLQTLVVMISTWFVLVAPIGQEAAGGSLSLTISAPKGEFNAREEIKLLVSLKNSDAQLVTIVQRSHWLNYTLSATDPNGEVLPETLYSTERKDAAEAGYLAFRQVKPGEEVAETLDLDKMFERKTPGVYKIRAQRWVSRTRTMEDPFLITSNELNLRIVPATQDQ